MKNEKNWKHKEKLEEEIDSFFAGAQPSRLHNSNLASCKLEACAPARLRSGKEFGLYIHIPYCKKICPYCDFNTYAVKNLPESEYVNAICSEYNYYKDLEPWSSFKLNTIYFGGGTPSIFSIKSVEKMLNTFLSKNQVDEISIELNPEHVTKELIRNYRDLGINRISLGIQSFDSEILKSLGRDHDQATAIEACTLVAQVFSNFSIDLIFGAPNQTLIQLMDDLEIIKTINPPHVSCYGLTIEKGTPFFKANQAGLLKIAAENEATEMYQQIVSKLAEMQLMRYEVSNFAKFGYESLHNLGYWNNKSYLGLGAGAHSYDTKNFLRRANIANPNQYIELITNNNKAMAWQEQLSAEDQLLEFLYTGLRQSKGIIISEKINNKLEQKLEELIALNLLNKDNKNYSLSNQGFLLLDSVLQELSAEI